MHAGFYSWPRRFRHLGLIVALLASLVWYQLLVSQRQQLESIPRVPADTCRIIEREILVLDIAHDSNVFLQWYLSWDYREETLQSYTSILNQLPYQTEESYRLQDKIDQRLAGQWPDEPDRSFLTQIFISEAFVLFCVVSSLILIVYFYFKRTIPNCKSPPLPWFSVGWVFMVYFSAEVITSIVTGGIYEMMYGLGIYSTTSFIIADGVYRGMIPFLVFAVSFLKWKHFKKRLFPDFKIHWKLVFLVLGGTYIFTYLLSYVLPYSDELLNLEQADPSLEYLVYIFFSGVIFAPLFEEITFRGFLFQGLRHKLGFFVAATISSILFASIHVQYDCVMMIYVGISGFAGCWITHRTGSLASGIVAHALHNFASFASYYIVYQQPL